MVEKPLLEAEPYFIPAIEQLNLVKEFSKPKDRFYTYRTRSSANVRERIKIISPSYDEELIGNGVFKAKPQFATDIDESYQAEFFHERSRSHYIFKPITEMSKMRETFRKRMEIYWTRERMVLDKLDAIRQKAAHDELKANIVEYENFLTEMKAEVFRQLTKAKERERAVFQEVVVLRKTRDELQDRIEPLKMKIFYHAINFTRFIMLQGCQYLFKSIEWRLENDHIHRTADGQLEGIRDSIAKIGKPNLWDDENVTIEAIMEYINKVYLSSERTMFSIFETGKAFLEAFKELQSKSFRPVQQFHKLAIIHANVDKSCHDFEAKNEEFIDTLTRQFGSLNKRRVFMEKRLKELQKSAMTLIAKPLAESVSSEQLQTLRGLSDATFQRLIIKKADSSLTQQYSSVEKVVEIEMKAFQMLKLLDGIPADLINQTEQKVRNERKRKLLQAERAYKIEMNLKFRIEQLRRCLAKPPAKEKRVGKLPMSVLPRKAANVRAPKPLLTSIEEEYIRAFTEMCPGGEGEIHFDENVLRLIDRIKNESTPFYLDHLLDTLGVQVSKETDEKFDKIFRDETKQLKFKDVIPSVRSKVKQWQAADEQLKKQNISKTKYLYE